MYRDYGGIKHKTNLGIYAGFGKVGYKFLWLAIGKQQWGVYTIPAGSKNRITNFTFPIAFTQKDYKIVQNQLSTGVSGEYKNAISLVIYSLTQFQTSTGFTEQAQISIIAIGQQNTS